MSTSRVGKTIADRLKYVREHVLGCISAQEMARRLRRHAVESHVPIPGSDHGSISKYEKGGTPSPQFLAAVVAISGVDGHWLLTGEGRPERTLPDEAVYRLQGVRDVLDAPYPPTSANGGPPAKQPPWPGEDSADGEQSA
jgi:hypothetical protein